MKSPSKDLVRRAREKAEHTQAQAAETVHTIARRWRAWESGENAMGQAEFELYLIKTQAGILYDPEMMKDWIKEQ